MKSNQLHWNKIFATTKSTSLGWYEKESSDVLTLLKAISLSEDNTAFICGAGTTTLIEQLLKNKMSLIINDISDEAIQIVQNRLHVKSESVEYLCQDISLAIQEKLPKVDIWIDRAVLHFLHTSQEIDGYFNNLNRVLNVGGYVLFAEFSKEGVSKCAGLDVHRYSLEELSQRLGNRYSLEKAFDSTYINPSGEDRAYIYALYKKIS